MVMYQVIIYLIFIYFLYHVISSCLSWGPLSWVVQLPFPNWTPSETHKGIETCSTVPCSEIFKANLHIRSTIFGHLKLNWKWPLCYKTNLSWNIANFIEILEEVLSFYDYYEICNYPLSLLEQKKDDLFEKNISKEKVNIP